MSRFLQIHALIFYPPSNPNRDDAGRPKTAEVGGVRRLRISSQALKRAWRTSQVMTSNRGWLTRSIPDVAEKKFLESGMPADTAAKRAKALGELFGLVEKPKSEGKPQLTQQSIFLGGPELRRLNEVIDRLIAQQTYRPSLNDVLSMDHGSPDVAMFGRMLTNDKGGESTQKNSDGVEKDTTKKLKSNRTVFNGEAAVQVAHAITTHRSLVDDDYFTACDDLNDRPEDTGGAFIGEQGFGSGVFYLYVCADLVLLHDNLSGNRALCGDAISCLTKAMATVSPSGKQAAFASRTIAHYLYAERGDEQPRTLAGAFAKPVSGTDLLTASVEALQSWRRDLAKAYGPSAGDIEMTVPGENTFADVVAFCKAAAEGSDG